MSSPSLTERFADYLHRQGLRFTPRRRGIVGFLATRGGHATLQSLVEELQARDPSLGSVTVYRTVRLLEDAGLLQRTVLDGVDHYELASSHHDHLVCEGCGAVLEFYNAAIEARQAVVAERLGFRMTDHTHVIRGRCRACRSR